MVLLLAGALLFLLLAAALSLFLFLPCAALAESVLADRPAGRAWLWLAATVLPPLLALAASLYATHDSVARAGVWAAMAHPGRHLCFAGLDLGPDAAWRITIAGLAAAALLLAGPLRALVAIGYSLHLGRLLRLAATSVPELGIHVLDLPGPSSFCHGLLRPRVYLTTGLTSQVGPDELELVLAHESAHRRRRDNLVGLLVALFSTPLLPVPTAHYYARAWRRSAELAADREACRDPRDKATLADALVRTARAQETEAGQRLTGLRARLAAGQRADHLAERTAQLLTEADRDPEARQVSLALQVGGLLVGLVGLLGLIRVAAWRELWPTVQCLLHQLVTPLH